MYSSWRINSAGSSSQTTDNGSNSQASDNGSNSQASGSRTMSSQASGNGSNSQASGNGSNSQTTDNGSNSQASGNRTTGSNSQARTQSTGMTSQTTSAGNIMTSQASDLANRSSQTTNEESSRGSGSMRIFPQSGVVLHSSPLHPFHSSHSFYMPPFHSSHMSPFHSSHMSPYSYPHSSSPPHSSPHSSPLRHAVAASRVPIPHEPPFNRHYAIRGPTTPGHPPGHTSNLPPRQLQGPHTSNLPPRQPQGPHTSNLPPRQLQGPAFSNVPPRDYQVVEHTTHDTNQQTTTLTFGSPPKPWCARDPPSSSYRIYNQPIELEQTQSDEMALGRCIVDRLEQAHLTRSTSRQIFHPDLVPFKCVTTLDICYRQKSFRVSVTMNLAGQKDLSIQRIVDLIKYKLVGEETPGDGLLHQVQITDVKCKVNDLDLIVD